MRCKQERRSWCSRFRKEQHKQEQRRSRCRKELHMQEQQHSRRKELHS